MARVRKYSASMGPSSPASPPVPHEAFNPENERRLISYLRRKIAGEPIRDVAAKFIHDADVYAVGPAELAAGFAPVPPLDGVVSSWFFFCHQTIRRRKIAGGEAGYWHPEAAKKAIVDKNGRVAVDKNGRAVGYKKSYCHRAKNGDKSGWLMKEFGVDQEVGGGGGERGAPTPTPVLCRIYMTIREIRPPYRPVSSASPSASKPVSSPSTSASGSASKPVSSASASGSPSKPVSSPSGSASKPVSSASASGSARKRNATDERRDQAASLLSPPSMRRRFLFPSHASPTLLRAVAEAEPPQENIAADGRAAPAPGSHRGTPRLVHGDAPDAAATPPRSPGLFLGGVPADEEYYWRG